MSNTTPDSKQAVSLAPSRVLELLGRWWPSGTPASDRFVAILVAACDASGTNPEEGAICFAGYLSTEASWAAFEPEWNAALAELGLEMLHMRELWSKTGAYAKWNAAEKEVVLSRFIEITHKHSVFQFGRVVPHALISAASPGEHREVAYAAAALGCIEAVARHLQAIGSSAHVKYVLDRGDRWGLLDGIDDEIGDRLLINGFQPLNKSKFLPLQAADLLAHQLREHSRRLLDDDKHSTRDDRMWRLLRGTPHDWRFVSKEDEVWKLALSLRAGA